MSEPINLVSESIDEQFADRSAATRRQLVAGTAATLGSMGLLSLVPGNALAARGDNQPQNILNIAATAEVLATIVNTVGPEKITLDPTTLRNVQAAAREELIHYNVLVSKDVGATALTTKIHVPDEVFASRENFLNTLVVGDQIFINAYMIGTTVFARPSRSDNSKLARITAEFMGAEAVHRALALQSLGKLGNDRVFMRFNQVEEADVADKGRSGFRNITTAVKYLEAAGFGFGKVGSKPGQMYDFAEVSKRTPDPKEVNTRTPA